MASVVNSIMSGLSTTFRSSGVMLQACKRVLRRFQYAPQPQAADIPPAPLLQVHAYAACCCLFVAASVLGADV